MIAREPRKLRLAVHFLYVRRALLRFIERKLYPNVDFYSGIIMRAIGIPLNLFTVMFAIGRMPGWIDRANLGD
jgi:citrate synthase